MIGELSEFGRRVLEAIRSGPVAWRTPGDVATALGLDPEAALDALADLDVAGWVEVWERPEGVAVTLTPLAAERLGVHLVEAGHAVRWADRGDPEPPPPRARGVCRDERAAEFETLVDPAPPPDEFLDLDAGPDPADPEAAAGPRPTLLVGLGLTPWPGPRQAPGPTCPACGSARLPRHGYCLRCDRWGRDRGPARAAASGRTADGSARPPRPRRSRAEDEASQRAARRRRKARRRARFTTLALDAGRSRPDPRPVPASARRGPGRATAGRSHPLAAPEGRR